MASNRALADTINTPVFELCNSREERFLRDMMRLANLDLSYLRLPDVGVLICAIEDVTGGACDKMLNIWSPGLLYNLAAYAYYADQLTHEERDESSASLAWHIHAILQGFMETVERAIRQGTFVRHTDDGAFLDMFQIPQWFFDEVSRES